MKQVVSEDVERMFGWLSELQPQLANHEPVILLNVSASEDSGILNSFDVTSLEQNMINLVLGAVSCIGVVPRLQLHRLVLEDDVCHNKIVGHTQVQQPGAIVSNWRWETKSANSTTP